jgi:hypothetical protein
VQLVVLHRRRSQIEQGAGDQIEQGYEPRDGQFVSAAPWSPGEQSLQFLGSGIEMPDPSTLTTR